MKTRTLRSGGASIALIAAGALLAVCFSCQKSNLNENEGKASALKIASLLNGTVLHGSVATQTDANQIALNYNNSNKIIFIAKLEDSGYPDVGTSQSADVIISRYGVYVNDLEHNKSFFLANNDPASINKFMEVKSMAGNGGDVVRIGGTTTVNASN